jgi:hypothetical protein
MLATCSVDKTVTLWDTYNMAAAGAAENYHGPPKACGNKDMAVGKLYTVGFYPSTPWLLGCGGGAKEVALWDMTREAPIRNRFGDRVVKKLSGAGEQKNSIQEDEEPVDESEQKKAFDAMMTPSTTTTTTEVQNDESPKKSNLSKKKKTGKEKKKKPHRAGR